MAMHKAIEIADWFIAKAAASGDLVTHLKVQKLLYYAEAWCQVILGKELFSESIQAWAHGPVVPEVFHRFKSHGWNALPIPSPTALTAVDGDARLVLEQVFETYGDLPAKTLEDMTHSDEPWVAARGQLEPEARCDVVMPKQHIKAFFEAKYAD